MDMKGLDKADDGCRKGIEWAIYGHEGIRKG